MPRFLVILARPGLPSKAPWKCQQAFACRCLEFSEPVLLVGETGTGKTTVCQMAARSRGQHLHILNCNQHTEASDFLGGFRPSRWAFWVLAV